MLVYSTFSAKGLGSFLGGQMQAHTKVGLPGVFQVTFGITGGLGLFALGLYHAVGKKWEARVLEEKEDLLRAAQAIIPEDKNETTATN